MFHLSLLLSSFRLFHSYSFPLLTVSCCCFLLTYIGFVWKRLMFITNYFRPMGCLRFKETVRCMGGGGIDLKLTEIIYLQVTKTNMTFHFFYFFISCIFIIIYNSFKYYNDTCISIFNCWKMILFIKHVDKTKLEYYTVDVLCKYKKLSIDEKAEKKNKLVSIIHFFTFNCVWVKCFRFKILEKLRLKSYPS